ncbi:hypothetical protein [Sulfurospirillum deleyianum]|uniref:Uncharacterized protein n=1 Tax=Sulfurospirillum deleyianum (strain ATCC 51133 / DSM 6946 / 5175) TaxID=525898 RepID=D1B1K4_SULD5|nr:hypothetical protein [Sulfurospirillum deleyianum]ACZ11974.1 hypothetical protein Sdel_0944 [Sulfurospirillum deleyianum DSM 6946]
MHKEIINASLNKKKQTKRQQLSSTKEKKTSLHVMEAVERAITHKGKKSTLDESSLNPRAKALLEELSSELGISKEVIAELAITLYRFCKDQV